MSVISGVKIPVMPPEISMEDFLRIGSELVLVMARALVNHPEQITVELKQGETTTVFCLTAAPGDTGQVIGKQGANVAAMRKILQAFSIKAKHRAVLEIIELASTQSLFHKAA
jgi:predicted RNA-binding protein YlqC (UPF0109 family)